MRASSAWLATPLLSGLAAVMLFIFFLHLGGEIGEGETSAFDSSVLHAAQALRGAHPWVTVVMRDLSGIGSTVSLALLCFGACGYLLLSRARRTAALVMLSVASAVVATELFKALFGRTRPPPAYAEFAATGLSFPSGHTSMSAVVFMTLGLLVARTRERRAERVYIVAVAALVAVLVGISRAMLGVHWGTDVIGGWAFGGAWATAWLLAAKHFDAGGSRK